jgi:hypothetical protein
MSTRPDDGVVRGTSSGHPVPPHPQVVVVSFITVYFFLTSAEMDASV